MIRRLDSFQRYNSYSFRLAKMQLRMETNVRIATYNVLSSSLGGADYYTKCRPEDLTSENRYLKLQSKLDSEISKKSVICLQEVSLSWSSNLHVYFAQNGYHFITGNYGNKFNGYMGVAIAVPLSTFEVLKVDITRVADTKRLVRKPKLGRLQNILSRIKSVGKTVIKLLPFISYKEQLDPWREALNRMNQMVSVRLKDRNSNSTFCLGTYHMPCMFRLPSVMMIHSSLSAQLLQKFAKSDPYIFAGDFNIKPNSSMYELLTTGTVPAEDPDLPEIDPSDNWTITVKPLRSAYKIFCGQEPDFTNYAQVGNEPEFIDTLDYILLSDEWKVRDVLPLPNRNDVNGPFPNEIESSDHVLLAVSLVIDN